MDKLLSEISIEAEYIEKTLQLINDALNRPKRSAIELSAIGSFLHQAYTGMENILKRIIKYKNIEIPVSASSHKDLLNIALEENIILTICLINSTGIEVFDIFSYTHMDFCWKKTNCYRLLRI
jgi:hypothetical protein